MRMSHHFLVVSAAVANKCGEGIKAAMRVSGLFGAARASLSIYSRNGCIARTATKRRNAT